MNAVPSCDGDADDADGAGGASEAGAAAVARVDLGGRGLRIVCVDARLPDHSARPGSSRLRQSYMPDEIAHFDWAGHRYALVPEGPDPACASAPAELHTLLTNRELQIVQLICNGLLTKQVSARLHISEFTVRSYLKTIYCKLGVRSRGAMVYAYAQSLASLPKGDGASSVGGRPTSVSVVG